MKFWHSFFVVVVVCISPFGVFAQEIEETQEEEGSINAILSEYWDKHIAIRFGASSATSLNSSDYRNYSFTNVSWQHNFGWIAFNFEGEAYRREYRYTLEVDNSERTNIDNQIRDRMAGGAPANDPSLIALMDRRASLDRDEFSFTTGENDIIYREANVKLISEYVQVSGGYHTVVWGQVEGFSPVDFILPLRFASGNLATSKVNSRIPQLSGIVSIFPLPWIEIQGYYFPELTLDATLRTFYEGQDADLDLDDGRQDIVEHGFEYPKNSEVAQYAGRVLFYLDSLTLGLIYYEGWDQFSEKKNTIISRQTTVGGMPYQYIRYEDRERLARVQNYGFESSLALGSWNIRLDILQRVVPKAISESKVDIRNHNFNAENAATITLNPNQQEQQNLREELFNFAIDKNDSSFDYEVQELIWAAAVDTDGDTWFFSFGLAAIQEGFADDNGSQLVDYADRIDELSGDSEDDGGFNGPIPFLTLIRYMSEDKKDIIGFSAGFLGGIGFGATIYFGQEYFESLQVGVALEVIQLFSNSEVERDVLDGYELKNEIYPAFRWIATYKF